MKDKIAEKIEGALEALPFIFGVVVVLVVIGAVGTFIYTRAHTTEHVGCVVIDKDRASTENGTSYRVYTDNCGVFAADDSLFDWKFGSADVYNAITVGESYDFKTRGVRIPILSQFENIISISVIEK